MADRTQRSEAAFTRAGKVLVGGVNSPVRAFSAVGGTPRFIVSAEDTNGIAALNIVEPNKTFVLPYNPTAENMARYLLEVVAPEVLGDLPVVVTRIVVWETDTTCATATR